MRLSVRICLLTAAAAMLFFAVEADSQINIHCCDHIIAPRRIDNIERCYEQKPRYGCRHHAFVITNDSGKRFCVKANPAPPWLKKLLNTGELKCPPIISEKQLKAWMKMYWNKKQ